MPGDRGWAALTSSGKMLPTHSSILKLLGLTTSPENSEGCTLKGYRVLEKCHLARGLTGPRIDVPPSQMAGVTGCPPPDVASSELRWARRQQSEFFAQTVFPPTPSGKIGLADHSLPCVPGPTEDSRERPAGKATSRATVTLQTDGGFPLLAWTAEQSRAAKHEFFCNFPSLLSFSVSFSLSLPFLSLFFNEKKKNSLLAQSLKSLTCDVNLSSLALSHCCWLCACLIPRLLTAICVSVSIMKPGFESTF